MTHSNLLIAPRRISTLFSSEERWFCAAERSLLLTYLVSWVVRVVVTGQLMYLWLVWNLFLAFVPLGIVWLYRRHGYGQKLWKRLLLAVAWLAFLPNAPYLITDLKYPFYATLQLQAPGLLLGWVITLPVAILGMWWYLRSIRYFEEELDAVGLDDNLRSTIIAGVTCATALGVWMGRDLRLNSWEILTNPIGVVSSTWSYLLQPASIELVFVTSVVLWGGWRFYRRYRWIGSALG